MLEEEIENGLTEEQKNIIIRMFESTDYEYSINDIIDELKAHDYSDGVGDIILDALYSNILDVSSIEDDGTMYLALGMEGEDIWEELKVNKHKSEEE